MVVVGFAITLVPEVELNPVDGVQKYDEAPLAVMLVEFPKQIAVSVGNNVVVGLGVTVIVICAVSAQAPFAPETV